MASEVLPADGPARIGPVPLPAGRRVAAGYGSGPAVAWVTSEPMAGAGPAWQALTDLHPVTGLVPILAAGLAGDGNRPWDSADFGDPADLAQLDRMDAAVVLGSSWDGVRPPPGESDEEVDPELARLRAPFGRRFPGLAPAQDNPLSAAELRAALAALPPARLALVPADRPADVLPLTGWNGVTGRWGEATPAAAVLRSWEARFGARLLEVGFAGIRVLAQRPPRGSECARRLAAEHLAFCDECGGGGLVSIADISARLLASPVWSFSWAEPAGSS